MLCVISCCYSVIQSISGVVYLYFSADVALFICSFVHLIICNEVDFYYGYSVL